MVRLDLFYHFIISMLITVSIIFILLTFVPAFKNKSPRFWQSEKKIRNHFLILIFLFAFSYAFVIGIGKEWLDYWDFGNVQASDVAADLAGIILGGFMMMKLVKKQFRHKHRIHFESKFQSRSQPKVNIFRNVGSYTKQAKSEESKSHAEYLFEQSDKKKANEEFSQSDD